MAFVLTIRPPLDRLPSVEQLLAWLRPVVGRTVRIDDETRAAGRRSRVESSWCPWPRTTVGFYVPGATTRGADVGVSRSGSGVEVKVVQPVLGTWTDWRTGIELAARIAEAAEVPIHLGPGVVYAPSEVRRRYADDDERWQQECLSGAEAVRAAVARGRVVRLGGPAGSAAVGPRSWQRLEVDPDDEAPANELLNLIQRSIEARGFETYYPANLLRLDGRSGREVIASLLAADVPTILRDPEYVLVADDLENRDGPGLFLLSFDDLDEALPRRLIWLDDRTCALPPIRKDEWSALVERMRPWLTPVSDLLDGPAGGIDDWRGLIPPEEPAPPPKAPETEPSARLGRPPRPWWKFWTP